MNVSARISLALALVLGVAADGAAQEWTRFRGPNGTGAAETKAIPTTWSESDFKWRVEVPGKSHSQPVIWEDRIFLESALDEGKERLLICVQKTDGRELWSKKMALPTHVPGNKNSGYANSSPAVDKDRVVASFASADQFLVKAWDHSGKELWTVNLGPFKSQHGLGASPVFYEDKVIVTNDQDGESFIVALDAKTGKTIWKTARKGVEQNTAYATPCILERKGQPTQLITISYGHGISGLDPKTGAMLWEAKVFDKRSVASPVVIGDLVFGSCGNGGGKTNFMVAVKLGGKGDVTSSHVAYTVKEATPYVPTPLPIGNKLFTISDNGIGTLLEAATGRIIWRERVGGDFFGSPVLVDGRIFFPSSKGDMVVLSAGDEYKLLARNPLGEGSYSTPCVEGDRMYVKTFTHLICLGGK